MNMKKIIIVFLSLFFIGCTKDNSTGIVPSGSAFSRLLFNNDKVDYYVVKK